MRDYKIDFVIVNRRVIAMGCLRKHIDVEYT